VKKISVIFFIFFVLNAKHAMAYYVVGELASDSEGNYLAYDPIEKYKHIEIISGFIESIKPNKEKLTIDLEIAGQYGNDYKGTISIKTNEGMETIPFGFKPEEDKFDETNTSKRKTITHAEIFEEVLAFLENQKQNKYITTFGKDENKLGYFPPLSKVICPMFVKDIKTDKMYVAIFKDEPEILETKQKLKNANDLPVEIVIDTSFPSYSLSGVIKSHQLNKDGNIDVKIYGVQNLTLSGTIFINNFAGRTLFPATKNGEERFSIQEITDRLLYYVEKFENKQTIIDFEYDKYGGVTIALKKAKRWEKPNYQPTYPYDPSEEKKYDASHKLISVTNTGKLKVGLNYMDN